MIGSLRSLCEKFMKEDITSFHLRSSGGSITRDNALSMVARNGFLHNSEIMNMSLAYPILLEEISEINDYRKVMYYNNIIYREGKVINYTFNTNSTSSRVCSSCGVKNTKLLLPFTSEHMCNDCRWKRVISMTRAKGVYSLKEDDLKRLDFYHYKIVGYGKHGTLYRLDDVKDVATIIKHTHTTRRDRKSERINMIDVKLKSTDIRELYKDMFKNDINDIVLFIRKGSPSFKNACKVLDKWVTFINIVTDQKNNKFVFISIKKYAKLFEIYKKSIQDGVQKEFDDKVIYYNNKRLAQSTRRDALIADLAKYDIILPENYNICKKHINTGTYDREYVVRVVREMDWFFNHTPYNKIVTDITSLTKSKFGFCNHCYISCRTKEIIITKIDNLEKIPDVVLNKYFNDLQEEVVTCGAFRKIIYNNNDFKCRNGKLGCIHCY